MKKFIMNQHRDKHFFRRLLAVLLCAALIGSNTGLPVRANEDGNKKEQTISYEAARSSAGVDAGEEADEEISPSESAAESSGKKDSKASDDSKSSSKQKESAQSTSTEAEVIQPQVIEGSGGSVEEGVEIGTEESAAEETAGTDKKGGEDKEESAAENQSEAEEKASGSQKSEDEEDGQDSDESVASAEGGQDTDGLDESAEDGQNGDAADEDGQETSADGEEVTGQAESDAFSEEGDDVSSDLENAADDTDGEISDEELEDGAGSAEEKEEAAAYEKTVTSGVMSVTVRAEAGVIPAGASVEVEEIRPITLEKADAYGEALASLSETLRDKGEAYSGARVYDIRIIGTDGTEIEPDGEVQVRMEYMRPQVIGESEDDVEVAHLDDEGELTMMEADVESNDAGRIEAAEFTTDGFSYYIVFGTQQGSEDEPIQFGDYGWLKFATPASASDWGHYQSESDLPATNTEEGYHRILKVNLWTLNTGGNETSYDSSNYTMQASNQYFWTWENSVYISDFYVPGYEVVQSKMHTAWDDESKDSYQDSLVGSYSVRGYRSSDGTDSDLNVLDVYMKSNPEPETAMRYIVRYVHADGSVTDGNVRYLSSGSTTINVDKPRSGEKFSGIAVAAGVEAVTADSSAKTVTFTYDSKVNLAKAYVYFEEDPQSNTSTTKGRYDKTDGRYYNGEKGLYTDKTAEAVPGEDREFLVNLEAWYVDSGASVGMVLDASGSMAWTAGVPTAYELTAEQVASIDTTKNSYTNYLSATDVDKLLDKYECDNSNNGYNGYKYYVYTRTINTSNPINEYAALGYTDNAKSGASTTRLGIGTYKGTADIVNANGAGWYFVNSGTNAASYSDHGAKRYQGLDPSYSPNSAGPCRFYVKQENGKWYLYCKFCQGSTSSSVNNQESKVYVKRDQMMTKAETLQDSIAQFGAILNGASPESETAMVRYSHTNFPNNLLLLNWTNSSEKIAAAMDLVPNAAGGVQRTDGTYQYGITGGTKARFGFNEYNSKLKSTAKDDTYKYLILFTDGKDQGTSSTEITTKAWLNSTFPGYTIITMFMRSVGMADSDVTASRTFLQGLASGGKNGNPNELLYYEAGSDNVHEVVEQFRQIAEYITTGLQNYSIRDYIDPRFNVVNEAGQVLSVLDSNGEFKHSTNPDVDENGYRGFTTPDGKQAQLAYDAEKKMFYVLWQNQSITSSAIASSSATTTVNPWQSQIRLVAKEDFIGGNDVLTNGNEAGENLVYKPKTTTDSQGNLVPTRDSYGREIVDTSSVSKSFPFAAVDPGLLDVKLGNYEDTIFLGEEITPGYLLSTMMGTNTSVTQRADGSHRVADSVYNSTRMTALGDTDDSSRWYVEYLERLGKKLHNNKDYYYTILQHIKLTGTGGVEPLITALKNDSTNYSVTDTGGVITVIGKTGTAADGETITITKGGESASIVLGLPYYYIESPTDDTSYAGPDTTGTDPQDDRVGTLTYTWQLKTFAENEPEADSKDEENRFVKFDTYVNKSTHMNTEAQVKYQFSMSYVPLALTSDAKNDDNGSARTRALTGQASNTDALIRNVVAQDSTSSGGTTVPGSGAERFAVDGEQNTTDEMGWAVIHAVDGRILIEKRILTEDYEKIKDPGQFEELFKDEEISFALTGQGITSASGNETVWTHSATIGQTNSLRTEGDYTYIVREWATGLPLGDYTLIETVSDKFKTPKIEALDSVEFYDDDDLEDPAEPYNSTAANWKAPYESSPVWHIGQLKSGVPGLVSYTDTDYTYSVVIGDLSSATPKNVDELLRKESTGTGKYYLNAQLGRARVTNELVYAHLKVKKTDAETKNALEGAVFEIYIDSDTPQSGTPVYSSLKDTEKVEDEDGKTDFTTGSDGMATLPDLVPGVYWLKEKTPPTGYAPRSSGNPIGIVVGSSGNKGTISLLADSSVEELLKASVAGPDGKDVYTVTVPNVHTRIYALPATGGGGIWRFLVLGGGTAAAFLALLYLARKMSKPTAA